ncbi:hypothetical protein GEMRC1_001049 [Eukaryota sp. GEM-RC1]
MENLSFIELSANGTTPQRRIFLKYLFQELSSSWGTNVLLEKFKDEEFRQTCSGLFLNNSVDELKYSVTFFSNCQLDFLTNWHRNQLNIKTKEERKQREEERLKRQEEEDRYRREKEVERSRSRQYERRSPPPREERYRREDRYDDRRVERSRYSDRRRDDYDDRYRRRSSRVVEERSPVAGSLSKDAFKDLHPSKRARMERVYSPVRS